MKILLLFLLLCIHNISISTTSEIVQLVVGGVDGRVGDHGAGESVRHNLEVA